MLDSEILNYIKSIHKKSLTILAMSAIILSCNNQNRNTESKSESKIVEKTKSIQNDDFVSNALNDYNIESIKEEFRDLLSCSKEPVINDHDESIVDTIYTFSNSNNKIEIYRAVHADMIITFDVVDERFKISKNIKPGMTKDEFLKKLKIKTPINDTLNVEILEGNMYFTFYFQNEILKRIEFNNYFD